MTSAPQHFHSLCAGVHGSRDGHVTSTTHHGPGFELGLRARESRASHTRNQVCRHAHTHGDSLYKSHPFVPHPCALFMYFYLTATAELAEIERESRGVSSSSLPPIEHSTSNGERPMVRPDCGDGSPLLDVCYDHYILERGYPLTRVRLSSLRISSRCL